MVSSWLTSLTNPEVFGLSVTTQSILLFLVVFLTLVKYTQSPRGLPPGPVGLPILGVLPLMGPKPHLTVQKWWAKYGDVYSLYMGSRFCIILNGVEVMKEALVTQSDTFLARPWNYFKKLTRNRGIVFTDGPTWREQRRFTLSSLRDFGMGKTMLEDPINTELKHLTSVIDGYQGAPFNPTTLLPKAVSNIICSIIYGSRFEYEDEVYTANINALNSSVRHQSLLKMIQFLPFLEVLPKILPKQKLMMQNVKGRDEYAQKQIDAHKVTCDYQSARDFTDAYLMHMKKLSDTNKSTTCDESQLHRTIQDLFIAGTETVNTTLKWSLLFMATHQDIQRKVQTEINHIIGQERAPKMVDKLNMPYTDATIMECQRLGNIALFSVPRCTTHDTMLGGHYIPKGTWVFVNRWGAHMSTRYWTNPEQFTPERFLNDDNEVVKPNAFIPFGMGPRNCLGESLAKMELFLFFTAMLQRYHVTLVDGEPAPSLEPQSGLNMAPHQYSICMRPL